MNIFKVLFFNKLYCFVINFYIHFSLLVERFFEINLVFFFLVYPNLLIYSLQTSVSYHGIVIFFKIQFVHRLSCYHSS